MKKQNLFKNKNGFSIIEIIVYLSIFTVVSILIINSLIVSMSSFGSTHTNHILMENGLSSMDRISREIRQASSIDVGNSSLSTNPGVLQLNSTDSLGAPVIIKISKVNNSLNLYKDNVLVGNLIDDNLSVDSLIFRRIQTSVSEAVKVEATIRDTKNKNNKTENFYLTVTLRGSY